MDAEARSTKIAWKLSRLHSLQDYQRTVASHREWRAVQVKIDTVYAELVALGAF